MKPENLALVRAVLPAAAMRVETGVSTMFTPDFLCAMMEAARAEERDRHVEFVGAARVPLLLNGDRVGWVLADAATKVALEAGASSEFSIGYKVTEPPE